MASHILPLVLVSKCPAAGGLTSHTCPNRARPARRRPALERAAAGGDPQHEARLRALDREEELLQQDLELLRQFAEGDAVVYNGERVEAK